MSGRHASRHAAAVNPRVGGRLVEPRTRNARGSGFSRRPVTGLGAALGVVLLASSVIDPSAGAAASPLVVGEYGRVEFATQSFALGASPQLSLARGTVDTKKIETVVAESATVSSDSSTATIPVSDIQDYARAQVLKRGWSESDFTCLVKLWDRESHWNYKSLNRGSGAYGIPQALPGSKMASAGSDWQTNPRTQVDWGLGYVAGRYSTPCGAWSHSQSTGWY